MKAEIRPQRVREAPRESTVEHEVMFVAPTIEGARAVAAWVSLMHPTTADGSVRYSVPHVTREGLLLRSEHSSGVISHWINAGEWLCWFADSEFDIGYQRQTVERFRPVDGTALIGFDGDLGGTQ